MGFLIMTQISIINFNNRKDRGLASMLIDCLTVNASKLYPKVESRITRTMKLGCTVALMMGATAGAVSAQGTWTETAPLPGSPYATMIVGLPNGNGLLTGGYFGGLGQISNWATLYNPVTNTWTTTTSMKYKRHSHTGTLLADGSALVVGGGVWNGVSYTFAPKAETYKPATKTWTATGAMITPRFGQTATLLADGRVLVTGGANFYYPRNNRIGYTASAEIYNPQTRAWSSAGSMSMARVGHSATLLSNGKVLVAGGSGINYSTSSTEIFDPTTGVWSSGPSMQLVNGGNTAGLLADGRVLVVGFNAYAPAAEIYDPSMGQWSAAATPASMGPLARLPNGNFMLVAPSPAPCLIYDSATDAWSPTGALNYYRAYGSLETLATGQVLLAGGSPTGSYGGELYNP
jgi:hypothetical protein